MKKSLYFACFVLALSACDKYEPVYTNVDDGKSVVLDLKGSIAGSVDGIDTSWKDDAQISAFVGYSVDAHQLNVAYAVSSIENGVASFDTKIKKVEEQSSYVALYPYAKGSTYDAVQDTIGFKAAAQVWSSRSSAESSAFPLQEKQR